MSPGRRTKVKFFQFTPSVDRAVKIPEALFKTPLNHIEYRLPDFMTEAPDDSEPAEKVTLGFSGYFVHAWDEKAPTFEGTARKENMSERSRTAAKTDTPWSFIGTTVGFSEYNPTLSRFC